MIDKLDKLLTAVIGITLAIVLVGVIMLAFNVIPWLLWNHAVAPVFGWPVISFWRCFFLWFGRIVFGSRESK